MWMILWNYTPVYLQTNLMTSFLKVYDNMEAKKEEVAEKKKEVDRKPKYIKQLLKSAEIRNKEIL